jgi:hypothetical protein
MCPLHSKPGETAAIARGELTMSGKRDPRLPRWVTRTEAMFYSRTGATKFNEMIQEKRIVAKKDGNRIKIDLNSIDDYLEALPNAAD